MAFTGKIGKDIFRQDSYILSVGFEGFKEPISDCIKISQGSRKVKKVDLPDFSVASSTVIESGELDLTFSSNSDNLVILDSWFALTSSGKTPGLLAATHIPLVITQISNSGIKKRSIQFLNCFIFERTEPDFDMQGADKMTEVTYKISYDECSIL
jgi:hypothetical protein